MAFEELGRDIVKIWGGLIGSFVAFPLSLVIPLKEDWSDDGKGLLKGKKQSKGRVAIAPKIQAKPIKKAVGYRLLSIASKFVSSVPIARRPVRRPGVLPIYYLKGSSQSLLTSSRAVDNS